MMKITIFQLYGTSKWALINVDTWKIAKINEELVEKYQPEDKSVFDERELYKLKEPKEYEKEIEYTVTRRDMDFNGHMHNIYYLDLAYETLPQDVYNKRPFNNVRIDYKKEIKFKDKIKCRYAFYDNKNIVTICKSEDEKIVHSIIELW